MRRGHLAPAWKLSFLGGLLESYLSIGVQKPLMVLWSSAETVDLVESALSKFPMQCLHISTAEREGVVSARDLDEDTINNLVSKLFAHASAGDSELNDFRLTLESKGFNNKVDVGLHLEAKDGLK